MHMEYFIHIIHIPSTEYECKVVYKRDVPP